MERKGGDFSSKKTLYLCFGGGGILLCFNEKSQQIYNQYQPTLSFFRMTNEKKKKNNLQMSHVHQALTLPRTSIGSLCHP